MKILMSVYGLFLGLFVTSYIYFISKTDIGVTEYLYQDMVFMVSWALLIIFLYKGRKHEGDEGGRIYAAIVYGILTWGVTAWIHYAVSDSYGVFIPALVALIAVAISYFMQVRLAFAHSFLILFCVIMVVIFFETEGVFWYKFMYTFGAEGARDALSKVWFALILTYIIQVIFAKIRNEKPKFSFPRYGIVRKDEQDSNGYNKESSIKKIPSIIPVKPSALNQQSVEKKVPPVPKKLIAKSTGTKKSEGRSETTTSKKLNENVNIENYFDNKKQSKTKKFLRDKINKQ